MNTSLVCNNSNSDTEHLKTIYNVLILRLKRKVEMSILEGTRKKSINNVIDTLSEKVFLDLLVNVYKKLTFLNLEYLVCFLLGIETRSIAIIFNIDYQTVYSVHYRMRKKIGNNCPY